MLKNIKIKHKLALMVVIPIIGLIYFTIALTLEKRNIVHEMNLLQELSELTIKSSSLIHEKERGISAGYLGSQGVEFSKELQRQRVNTDKVITKLEDCMKERLNEVMKSNGLNIKKFSSKSEIPYRTLQNYLLGLTPISVENAIKICTKFDIDIRWLLMGEKNEHGNT